MSPSGLEKRHSSFTRAPASAGVELLGWSEGGRQLCSAPLGSSHTFVFRGHHVRTVVLNISLPQTSHT